MFMPKNYKTKIIKKCNILSLFYILFLSIKNNNLNIEDMIFKVID